MKAPRTFPKEFHAQEVLDTMVDKGVSFGLFGEVRREGDAGTADQRCTDLWYCLRRVGQSGKVGGAILNGRRKLIVAELVSEISFHQPIDRIEQIAINVVHGQLPFFRRYMK
jgi:hypothetical protein